MIPFDQTNLQLKEFIVQSRQTDKITPNISQNHANKIFQEMNLNNSSYIGIKTISILNPSQAISILNFLFSKYPIILEPTTKPIFYKIYALYIKYSDVNTCHLIFPFSSLDLIFNLPNSLKFRIIGNLIQKDKTYFTHFSYLLRSLKVDLNSLFTELLQNIDDSVPHVLFCLRSICSYPGYFTFFYPTFQHLSKIISSSVLNDSYISKFFRIFETIFSHKFNESYFPPILSNLIFNETFLQIFQKSFFSSLLNIFHIINLSDLIINSLPVQNSINKLTFFQIIDFPYLTTKLLTYIPQPLPTSNDNSQQFLMLKKSIINLCDIFSMILQSYENAISFSTLQPFIKQIFFIYDKSSFLYDVPKPIFLVISTIIQQSSQLQINEILSGKMIQQFIEFMFSLNPQSPELIGFRQTLAIIFNYILSINQNICTDDDLCQMINDYINSDHADDLTIKLAYMILSSR